MPVIDIKVESPTLKVLLEMRGALGGNAGIPQETRLLFRGLSMIQGVEVAGMLQHTDRVLPKGVTAVSTERQKIRQRRDDSLNRMGRVVITLEQKYWDSKLRAYLYTIAMACWHHMGGRQRLTKFEPAHFKDFLWRKLFAQTLPPSDFDLVTQREFRILREPWNAMQICALVTRKMGWPSLFPRLDTSEFDLMIAETPYPASVSKRTTLIVRYHDAIPLTMPHTISDKRWHHAFHYHALKKNVAKGAWFACVSDATRKDLLSAFPQAEPRTVTIYNMVSHDYFDEQSSPNRIRQIINTRINKAIKPPVDVLTVESSHTRQKQADPIDYVLMVATIEPRKNHETLLAAWEKMTADQLPSIKLVFVGKLGWHHDGIIDKFRPWMERGDAFFLADVPSADLRLLYKHARVTVCPSYGEGFDYAGVEAMKSGGPVIASDIPVHREIYDDAAEFFNPYSYEDLCNAMHRVIDPASPQRRNELIARGRTVSERYSFEAILPQWVSFLKSFSVIGAQS